VPAQKKPIESATLADSSGRSFWAIQRPATSHGFPTKTDLSFARSISKKPSQGDAGEYRDPVLSTNSALDVLRNVLFFQGFSGSLPMCSTPPDIPCSKQNRDSAVHNPPDEPLNRISSSEAKPSHSSMNEPHLMSDA
jgi:hypothetical protein